MNLKFDSISAEQHAYLPEGARNLIWDVFFASRQRGISLDYHFPWLLDEERIACVTLSREFNGVLETQAALVIKKQHIEIVGTVGLIGLVCVDVKHRGRGLSTRLIRAAEEYAKRASLNALLLWTTKPDVYEKVGFTIDSIDLYGTARKATASLHIGAGDISLANIRVEKRNNGGVPAFANEVIEFSTGSASVTACKTNQGLSLAEWHGDPQEIVALINNCFPNVWQINAAEYSPLIPALQGNGYSLDLRPGATRMVLGLTLTNQQPIPYIKLLDRI